MVDSITERAVSEQLSQEPLNDIGNAHRLITRYGANFRYVRGRSWFYWTGTFWNNEGGKEEINLAADKTVACLLGEALVAQNCGPWENESDKEFNKRIAELNRFSIVAGNTHILDGIVSRARNYLTGPPDKMDANPCLLNLQNGTLVLEGSCEELGPHDRDDLITKLVPVSYDPNAECPQFTDFIQRILPDLETRLFVQRWFGYYLTGLTGEQVLVFFYGSGANGKSTLLNIMAKILGPYAVTLPFASLQRDDFKRGSDATLILFDCPALD